MASSAMRWPSISSRTIFRQRIFSPSRQTLQGQIRHQSASRIDRVNSRLPRFLQKYTTQLRSAPVTHITAFLLLHELTAIAPLFGFAALFHYTNWLPPFISEGKWVNDGVNKFGNYFRRKGWLGAEDAKRAKVWGVSEGGVRIVVEFATAYALTKMLLPVRVVASVWATPWFARVFVSPVKDSVGRLFRRGAKRSVVGKSASASASASLSPAAGTNAVGGGAIGKP